MDRDGGHRYQYTNQRRNTTRIWRQPSWIESLSEDASFTSMDSRDERVISTLRTACLPKQNGSEFPELAAQSFRNPQESLI